jgi:hypothetical protein
MPVRSVVSWWRAATWLSVNGANGELGDGLWRAAMMSWRPARMRSVEDARGMGMWDGNQDTVSVIRAARVAITQTV